MSEWILFLLHDLHTAYQDLQPNDFAKPVLLAFWTLILFFPLKGVDRRDIITGITFSVFLIAAAAILLYAVPQEFGETPTVTSMLTTFFVIGGAAAFRWFFRIPQLETVTVKKTNSTKGKK